MSAKRMRWITLILLAAVLSGCSVSGSVRWEPRYYFVSGRVHLDHGGPPIVGAEVFFNGPADERAVTDAQGRYSLYLPIGNYDVTIRTLHRTYTARVMVDGQKVVNFPVLPAWYDRDVFTGLSGIMEYEYENGRLTSYPGQLTRWDQATVRVYFDTASAPWEAPSRWDSEYLKAAKEWQSLLANRIRIERTYSRHQADVIVELVPRGWLGQDRIAVHSSQAYNGVLERVTLRIDVGYATDRSMWEHEWAHAMGVYHSPDEKSVMYPAVMSGQRTSLSLHERRHIQLMYDLQPGLAMHSTWGIMSIQSDGEQQSEFVVLESGLAYSGHARTVDGDTVPLTEYEAESLLFDD